MTRWHRPVRIALGLSAVVFAIVVYLAIGRRPPAPSDTAGTRSDPTAVAESTGGEALVARGARQDYMFRYGRCLTYEGGTLKCDDVNIDLPQRGGRDFTIRAKKGTVTNNQANVALEGDVRLTASDGLAASAEQATYDATAGLVRVPGPVAFTRGRMTGQAVGASYDKGRDVLWLLDKVRIAFAPDPAGAGAGAVDAGAAGLAHRDRYFRFDRRVRMTKEGQVAAGDTGVGYLAADVDRLERVELRGNARVASAAPAAGGLEAMTARDIDLVYGPDGQNLQRATLNGNAVVQLAGSAAGQAGRRLTGETIDIGFAPDGATLTSLLARRSVQLDLPAEATGTTRRIRAAALDASGPPDRGLTRARFIDDVEFRETRAATRTAPAVDRVARSRTLDTAVQAGFGAIDAATFSGGVTFTEASRDATAAEAVYTPGRALLQLVAGAAGGPGGTAARVDDARATIQARKIDLELDGGSLAAEADVKSVLKSSAAPRNGAGSPAAPAPSVKRPAMLRDNQPVNVTARHLAYDDASNRAVYTGEARLWQGETAIHADSITIDDARGDLVGKGHVRSTLRLAQKDPKTGASEPRTTVITADLLQYEDAARRATYTGSPRLNGPEGDLRAERIELFLDQGGGALERLEAYTNVSLTSEGRASTGERLTYFAADERYVMSGSPVRILEQLPQECRETIGRTLTFFRSTDSISVDGNDESRTQTTSGGKCPEPKVD